MTSVAPNPMDFEEEAKKAREYYMCKNSFIERISNLTINKYFLDGDYSKGITFYKLAIDKLRRYCQTLSNAAEKKRGTEVCSLILIVFLVGIYNFLV
jgi:hypothetical protein